MIKADLHIHSQYSLDGEFSVAEIIGKCQDQQLDVISITDHNSIRGIREAVGLSAGAGISFIPGIEIDCIYEGIDLHVLGYNIDWPDRDFLALEESVHRKNREIFPQMVEFLRKAGITVDADEVISLAKGRPPSIEQIAEVLISNPVYHENRLLSPYLPGGARSDMPYINFYLDYFAQGKAAYVKIDFMPYQEAITLIRKHGGIPVIAHPGINLKNRETVIHQLLDEGASGLEAFNNYHDYDQIAYFAGIAIQRNLLVTCGSDFHGKNKPLILPGAFKQVSRFEENIDRSIRILLNQESC